MRKKLSGIFAPINTPFRRNEEIDLEGLSKNVQYYLSTQLDGLLLLGSNSEYKSLSEEEKVLILNLATDLVGTKKRIIAGLMYDSLFLAKKFLTTVSHFPIDYILVQPPFYFKSKLSESDYFQYYKELSNISPFPILIYNAPGFTGVDLSESLINQIGKIDKVVGIKDSSKVKKKYPLTFSVLTGTANTLLEMLNENAVGGVVSLANYFPELPIQIYSEYKNGNSEKARHLQEVAIILNKMVSGSSGVAGVKAAMDAVGLTGGYMRKPLKRLLPDDVKKIRDSINQVINGQENFSY